MVAPDNAQLLVVKAGKAGAHIRGVDLVVIRGPAPVLRDDHTRVPLPGALAEEGRQGN